MPRLELSDREQRVLRILIDAHVRTARPVSSSAIASARAFPVSSATVRNVLRSLEEKKLILQPHTSAGRIPTDRGYRHYVDFLMEPTALSGSERGAIDGELESLSGTDHDTVATEVSRIVSEFAKELAVSVAPGAAGILERVDLVPLSPGRAVAAATMRSGATKTVAVTLDDDVGASDIREAAGLLNDWLGGEPVADAESVLVRRMRGARPEVRKVLRALLDARSQFLRPGEGQSVHYEGARYIFRHPEFMSDAACLGDIFDSEEALARAVRGPAAPTSVTIRIGRENPQREMRRMSLVVGTYRFGGGLGRVGVIGPTRMKYPRLVGLVEYLSGALDRMFAAKP
ncbi:MAG: heat-inducible transcriptional repressor HrcA [Candidatus Eisenbacteria bacterium]